MSVLSDRIWIKTPEKNEGTTTASGDKKPRLSQLSIFLKKDIRSAKETGVQADLRSILSLKKTALLSLLK